MQNLITCQDLIREEAQVHQQEQEQLTARIRMLQLVGHSPFHDEQIGARDTAAEMA